MKCKLLLESDFVDTSSIPDNISSVIDYLTEGVTVWFNTGGPPLKILDLDGERVTVSWLDDLYQTYFHSSINCFTVEPTPKKTV